MSSAVSFYVLTRSGLAGTLGGAAVAGIVYNLTSLGINHGLSKSSSMVKRTAEDEVGDVVGAEAVGAEAGETGAGPAVTGVAAAARAATGESAAGEAGVGGLRRAKASLVRWLPALLGAAALMLSIWAVADHNETTVIHERVVQQATSGERLAEAAGSVQQSGGTSGGTSGGIPEPAHTTSTTGAETSTTVPSTTASTTTTSHSTTTTSAGSNDSTTTLPTEAPSKSQDPGTSQEGSTSESQNR